MIMSKDNTSESNDYYNTVSYTVGIWNLISL